MFALWIPGRKARWLCGWPGGEQAHRGGEEEEQSWGGRETFPGTIILENPYRGLFYEVNIMWL